MIDLIIFGENSEIAWNQGKVYHLNPSANKINNQVEEIIHNSGATYVMFWDSTLGQLPEQLIQDLINKKKGDLWHGGLHLGNNYKPSALSKILPGWMLNNFGIADFDVTSFKLSWRASLIPVEVLQTYEGFSSDFEDLEMSFVDFGFRCLKGGLLPRFIFDLVPASSRISPQNSSLKDEVVFLKRNYSGLWVSWFLFRSIVNGEASVSDWFTYKKFQKQISRVQQKLFKRKPWEPDTNLSECKVSIVIITLNRYDYLRRLLPQLEKQTILPHEILLIDDTKPDQRIKDFGKEFTNLPFYVFQPDPPTGGQCSARNFGIEHSKGDYVLFMDDDDDEVPENLVETHLNNLHRYKAEVSCGEHDEVGALPVDRVNFSLRASDVFPTINTMVKKTAFNRSGIFDRAMDKGQSEDHDLGMRLFRSGAVMVIDPENRVLHNRAPIGGLRTYKNRMITYSSSRTNLFHRRLPHISEFYMLFRYYDKKDVINQAWLSAFGTFSIRGGKGRKLLKVFISMLFLPKTVFQLRKKIKLAEKMYEKGPDIPRPQFD